MTGSKVPIVRAAMRNFRQPINNTFVSTSGIEKFQILFSSTYAQKDRMTFVCRRWLLRGKAVPSGPLKYILKNQIPFEKLYEK